MRPQHAQARASSFLSLRLVLCFFLPTPVLVSLAPPNPRGRLPLPPLGFLPWRVWFSLPPLSRPACPLELPSHVDAPHSDHLSVFTPVGSLGTGHLRAQLLRSVAFLGLPGGIVRFYSFSFWEVLVLDSGDSVFLLSPGSSSLVLSEFFNVVSRAPCKRKFYVIISLVYYISVFFASESLSHPFPSVFNQIFCPGISSAAATPVSYPCSL